MPVTKELFKELVNKIESKDGYQKPLAFALGVRRTKGNKTLDVFYPHINYNTAFGTAALLIDACHYNSNKNGFNVLTKSQLSQVYGNFVAFHSEIEIHPNIVVIKDLLDSPVVSHPYYNVEVIVYFLFENESAVESAEEGYFKLQCLSQ